MRGEQEPSGSIAEVGELCGKCGSPAAGTVFGAAWRPSSKTQPQVRQYLGNCPW
jgi:hypothetical protein